MRRRTFFQVTLGAGASALLVSPGARAQTPLPAMTVYKSASCGCCRAWVEHARGAGFTVRTIDTEDLAAIKREMDVPARLQSCHTVVMGKYVLEGHVPATDAKRLLRERPAIRGLAVPGMPVGAPGMEQGPRANYDRYEVIAFAVDGTIAVYSKH